VSGRARLGRHDHPGLCAVVVPLEAEVGRETHRLTVELLGAAIQQTLDLVRGLGLSALLSDDGPRRRVLLAYRARHLDARLT
jgi:hypothetical protein